MAVEVILKKPVDGLGAEADVVRVKPGFARNFLIPRGIAVVATATSKKQVDQLKKIRAEREARELNDAQELASKLGKLTLTFQMSTGGESSKAKVFGSITAQDLASRLAEQGYEIDKKKIQLPQPIKNLGETSVNLNLGNGIQAKLKVVLVSANGEEAATSAKQAPKKKEKKKEKTAKGSSEAETE
jgi:large subunit ribosomal protein L9